MRTSRDIRMLLPVSIVFLFAAVRVICAQQEKITAEGILTRGNTLLLFTKIVEDPCDSKGGIDTAQIFVSDDGGRTWIKRGPALEGSEFQYVLDTGSQLWIAGEHVAEGPAADPFLLRYGGTEQVWRQHEIYDGDAELLAIAKDKAGKFAAWVRHVKLGPDGWSGPTFLHTSGDQGRSWKAVEVSRVPSSRTGFAFFKKIEEQHGSWRIADLGEEGFAVEHIAAEGTWQTLSKFPLPPCAR